MEGLAETYGSRDNTIKHYYDRSTINKVKKRKSCKKSKKQR